MMELCKVEGSIMQNAKQNTFSVCVQMYKHVYCIKVCTVQFLHSYLFNGIRKGTILSDDYNMYSSERFECKKYTHELSVI